MINNFVNWIMDIRRSDKRDKFNRLKYKFPLYEDLTRFGVTVFSLIYSSFLYFSYTFLQEYSDRSLQFPELAGILTFLLGMAPVITGMKKDYKNRRPFSMKPTLSRINHGNNICMEYRVVSNIPRKGNLSYERICIRKAGKLSPIAFIELGRDKNNQIGPKGAHESLKSINFTETQFSRIKKPGRYEIYAYIRYTEDETSEPYYFTSGVCIWINAEKKRVSYDIIYLFLRLFFHDPLSLKE